MTFSNKSYPCVRYEGIWSCQLHGPDALPPQKESRYSLNRRLNGPQSQSVRSGVFPLREIEPLLLGHAANSLVLNTAWALPSRLS